MVYQKPLKVDDLNPDTIKIVIDWSSMVVGASVFIPCVDNVKAKEQLQRIVEAKGWKAEIRTRIENKMFGVRIWRTV
jgi:hypothetical protein